MSASWDRRSASEHERVEQLLLQRWLPEVAAYSPYWGERVAELGVAVDAFDSREDLARLAPIRERDIASAGGPGGPALLMRPTENQVKSRAGRSLVMRLAAGLRRAGPAGKRLELLLEYKPIHLHRGGAEGDLPIGYSRSDLDRLHRLGARAAAVLDLTDTDYLLSTMPPGPWLDYAGIYHLGLGSSMLAVHPGDDESRIVSDFDLAPITAVAVPLEDAADLAGLLKRSGVDVPRVGTVITVGPTPFADEREEIIAAWREAGAPDAVRVRAAWAPSEARALWVECAEGGEGLHTYPDHELLEVIDPLTGEVSPTDGDLTYTSAGWNGTALVRYQTGAYVEAIATGACDACGRTVPRIMGEVAPGAWQPYATDGEDTIDFRGASAVLVAAGDVTGWRMEIVRNGTADEVVVEVAGSLDQGRVDELTDRLAPAIGRRPARVTRVDDPATVDANAEQAGGLFADLR